MASQCHPSLAVPTVLWDLPECLLKFLTEIPLVVVLSAAE
jgi:hypothetical protein